MNINWEAILTGLILGGGALLFDYLIERSKTEGNSALSQMLILIKKLLKKNVKKK